MSNRLFTQVPVPKFPSSTFSLSRSVMFTPRIQKLYCPNVIETIPGDGINEQSEQFARTQPMIAPTFAKMNAQQFAFFVPFWQINEHFDDFITGGEKGDYQDKMPHTRVEDFYDVLDTLLSINGETASDVLTYQEYNVYLERIQSIIEHCDLIRAVPFTLPDFVQATAANLDTVAAANYSAFLSLNSHLSGSNLRVNYAPFVSYLKVWCEYFRDENLCEDYFDTIVKTGTYGSIKLFNGVGAIYINDIVTTPNFTDAEEVLKYADCLCALFGVLPHAWKKDYFTAALPFTQKGPDVLLPISGVIDWEGPAVPTATSGINVQWKTPTNATTKGDIYGGIPGASTKITGSINSANIGATIQDVRRAFRLQEFYEADARGGNRYPENTLMQFGVRTPDSRLPRAIFLGSNSSPVQVSEVVQTSSTDGTSPQGNLAGKGISYGSNRLSRYFYSMHGFLLNLYTINVHAVYEQGIHPMFSRYDRTEYAWPRFAHLGEQPVYLKELFVNGSVTENEVFGYEPRYSEYKSEKSSVHGGLKGSLNFWTMSRRFADKPVLNEEFIYGSPRLDNFAVVNKLIAPFIVEIDYRVRANRKLPFFGVPML